MVEMLIVDKAGLVVASLSDGENIFMPGPAGDEVRDWVTKGAPTLEGMGEGTIAERVVKIVPTAKAWGLAVLEECERRGWGVYSTDDNVI